MFKRWYVSNREQRSYRRNRDVETVICPRSRSQPRSRRKRWSTATRWSSCASRYETAPMRSPRPAGRWPSRLPRTSRRSPNTRGWSPASTIWRRAPRSRSSGGKHDLAREAAETIALLEAERTTSDEAQTKLRLGNRAAEADRARLRTAAARFAARPAALLLRPTRRSAFAKLLRDRACRRSRMPRRRCLGCVPARSRWTPPRRQWPRWNCPTIPKR